MSSKKLYVESQVFKWPLDNENQIGLSDLEQENQVGLPFFIKKIHVLHPHKSIFSICLFLKYIYHAFFQCAQTDAIATLVGLVLPALYPPCHCFVKCGPIYIHSKECINMFEVTVHGMVTCRCTDATCPYDCDDDPDNRKYIIRLNIDLSSDHACQTKYYVPKDVATEMLAGMFAHNLVKALYVTVTKDAVTVVEHLGMQSIWDDALSIMVDLYGVQNIKWPTKLHPGVRQLHEDRVCSI